MTRSAPVLVAAAALGVLAVGGSSTASNTVPRSTAAYNTVTVSGAKMTGISYTVAAGVITGFTVQLKGVYVLSTTTLITTAKAHFNSNLDTPCTVTTNLLAGTSTVTCAGFTQTANRSWRLTVSVS
jgi:hypothetical protein